MNHTPFIAGSYAAFTLITLWLVISAATRLKAARGKLRAVDPRAREDQE